MKIVVLMGSPNRNGSTGILVQNFQKGAEEAGHSVDVIDVCHANSRRREWLPTPVFLPGKSCGQRNLVSYNPWGRQRAGCN